VGCSVEGCSKHHHSKGYCQAHYRLFRKYGTPTTLSEDQRKKPGPKPGSPKPRQRVRGKQTAEACAKGHPWSEDTVYLSKSGKKVCRYCQHVAQCKYESRTPVSFEEWLQDRRRRALYCPNGHLWSETGRISPATGWRVCTACQSNVQRKLKYGMDASQYARLLEKQNHACAICEEPFGTSRPHVDHDHSCCPNRAKSCGACVRGLLCTNCNNGLGRFKDNADTLRKAAYYLEQVKLVTN